MAPNNYGEFSSAVVSSADTEAKTIARIAQQAANAEELYPGKLYLIAGPDGGMTQIDTYDYDTRPRGKSLSVTVADFPSFAAYLNKHGLEGETEISAHETEGIFSAVIDAGTDDEPGWRHHQMKLALTPSDEWKTWTAQSGKLMTQEAFAEFIEDNARNVVTPSSAELLEVAQSLQVKRGVDFESGTRLSDGNVQFGYRETTTATAGTAGSLTIPATLELALAPFRGGAPYRVPATFRYRLQDKRLALGFKLQNADQVRRDAFAKIADEVYKYANADNYLYLYKG